MKTQLHVGRRLWMAVMAIVLTAALIVSVPGVRRRILCSAGQLLVANDPAAQADIIVVAIDTGGAGALEAADLVHSGVATHVAVFTDYSDAAVEDEFIRRGIAYEGDTARTIQELRNLGIESIVSIPGYVAGTEDEGPVLAAWCDQQRFRAVIVVSTSDHSRRLRRVLRRSMNAHSTKVAVRSAHYSIFAPDGWWRSHGGVRTEIEEVEKLSLDFLRHPIS